MTTMASARFHVLLQSNQTVFDRPLAEVGNLLEAAGQAKIKMIATLTSQKASIKRAKELMERCDKLLNETQALGKE
ncbi:hypothetical protein SAMN05216167_14821 [Spirosoma endophyticum]|uniref:Uncharacterized protein n=2 Tax=Spirosoma endophyticum TaxID=662367 RepID=A0A1I2HUE4_9BACT|nr:hypothetical protein SAMN05216167_14821 [Spirosoma endophyticum]